jgi:hypothetical protein
LTTDELLINDSVDIQGPGAALLTINGNDAYRIFEVDGPVFDERIAVTISGLTMTNGNGNAVQLGFSDGGALLATNNVTMTIRDSIIKDSVGNNGGGVAAFGSELELVIENSQILNNECVGVLAGGGGVDVSGRAFQFLNSTADGNVSSYSGGGLSIQTETGIVMASTISNNIASDGGGGGIQGSLTNTITITNSTIADNQANGGFSGGGILAFANMAINNSTIARNIENSEGGTAGIEAFLESNVTLLSCLVVENDVPGDPVFWAMDVGGEVTSLGNNLIGDSKGSEGTAWLESDILDKESHLPELADNGGPTKTILPDGASFANGNGANPLGLPFDQRGEGFPRGGDIGAVSGGNPRVNPGSGDGAGGGGGGTIVVGDLANIDTSSDEGYIRALYFTILGREVDLLGLSTYTQDLRRGDSRESVARAIWTSPEHRAIQVAGYFRTFLDRNGSQSEIAAYVQTMLDGADEEEIIASILSSHEYRNRFATNDLYVVQLYQDLLGRTPALAEISSYVNALNGGSSREDVASSIATSVEARNLQLTDLYEQLLLRTPADAELAAYQDRFDDEISIGDLAVELASSAEMVLLGQRFIPVASAA